MADRIRAWDDYFIPGALLGNKFGSTDAKELQQREEFAAHIRIVELAARPLVGSFNYAHLKAIHRRWNKRVRVVCTSFSRHEGVLAGVPRKLAARKNAAAELVKVVGDRESPQAVASAYLVHGDLIADVW